MGARYLALLREKKGGSYVDTAVFVLIFMLCLSFFVKVTPVFIAKYQLNAFASELVRTAEIAGRVGSETSDREQKLREEMGIEPEIAWSLDGQVQLNEEVSVTLTLSRDIGFFTFGSFPVEVRSEASGRSEVYWK
jgi:hypothetical protein